MASYKEIKKDLALKQKETKKLEKELAKAELDNKLSCITDIIYKNKNLCNTIIAMPGDEVKLVMSEIINSTEFMKIFEAAFNSESLSVLRKNKAEKAEKRKIVKADANQTYDSVHDVSKHSALSEQAEVSEQTMKPDYTGDISNY